VIHLYLAIASDDERCQDVVIYGYIRIAAAQATLGKREAVLAAQGFSNPVIAKRLPVTIDTVKAESPSTGKAGPLALFKLRAAVC
jgi:hypothetical protein